MTLRGQRFYPRANYTLASTEQETTHGPIPAREPRGSTQRSMQPYVSGGNKTVPTDPSHSLQGLIARPCRNGPPQLQGPARIATRRRGAGPRTHPHKCVYQRTECQIQGSRYLSTVASTPHLAKSARLCTDANLQGEAGAEPADCADLQGLSPAFLQGDSR